MITRQYRVSHHDSEDLGYQCIESNHGKHAAKASGEAFYDEKRGDEKQA
jgi:hypothetical protein